MTVSIHHPQYEMKLSGVEGMSLIVVVRLMAGFLR